MKGSAGHLHVPLVVLLMVSLLLTRAAEIPAPPAAVAAPPLTPTAGGYLLAAIQSGDPQAFLQALGSTYGGDETIANATAAAISAGLSKQLFAVLSKLPPGVPVDCWLSPECFPVPVAAAGISLGLAQAICNDIQAASGAIAAAVAHGNSSGNGTATGTAFYAGSAISQAWDKCCQAAARALADAAAASPPSFAKAFAASLPVFARYSDGTTDTVPACFMAALRSGSAGAVADAMLAVGAKEQKPGG